MIFFIFIFFECVPLALTCRLGFPTQNSKQMSMEKLCHLPIEQSLSVSTISHSQCLAKSGKPSRTSSLELGLGPPGTG